MSGAVLLAFGLWMLLTTELSPVNVCFGLVAAVLVSWLTKYHFSALQLLRLVGAALFRLPQALAQTLWIVLLPHRHERTAPLRLQHPQDPWLTFCEIFLVTYTPKSLVISDEEDGTVQVHSLERKGSP